MIKVALLSLAVAAAMLWAWRHAHADESPNTSCGPGRGHDCHCPRMVQRRRDEEEEKCRAIMDKEENAKCLAAIMTTCQMVAHPRRDEETGALEPDSCFKYCKYQDLCFCNDSRCTMNGDPLPTELPDKYKNLPHAPKRKGKKEAWVSPSDNPHDKCVGNIKNIAWEHSH